MPVGRRQAKARAEGIGGWERRRGEGRSGGEERGRGGHVGAGCGGVQALQGGKQRWGQKSRRKRELKKTS